MTPVYRHIFTMQNVSVSLNAACLAAQAPGSEWQCFLAAVTLPYIQTPLLVSNSLADSWQRDQIMNLGCDR